MTPDLSYDFRIGRMEGAEKKKSRDNERDEKKTK